ncbi:MAG TPA: hypothetical protein VH183_03485 [Burkholderiaceae bacterium]|nr:hypothetical protein [Burkholderiaceae bacterium]
MSKVATNNAAVIAWALFLALLGCGRSASAQTDEIQVYDATINAPGQFSVQLHNNYTPIGRREPAFPGGVVPNHAWNGVPEWAYGVTDWFELGTYLPLYTRTNEGRFELDGAKLRALFVVPHARERTWFYGLNFELSFNARHWEDTRRSGEIRPIIGTHLGPWDLIANPIIDTGFNGVRHLDFAPAERVAYNFSPLWAVALEHYADYGFVSGFNPLPQQDQTGFAVIDYNGAPNSVEFGIGHGFTEASDGLVLRLMITHEF